MPVPLTYDGVDGGSSEDLLFTGTKFWLALRVPQRNDWIAKIHNNGGEVVKLERMADMLIVDHAKPKLAPPGKVSYSWKFIDEAIKRGELPDKEDFLVQPPGAGQSAAPASSANVSGKSTRTAYTPEDDRALTEWVRRRLDRAKANAIYEEFARINPRHPWQSWRDRWVKRLCLLPGNNVPLMDDSEEEQEPAEQDVRAAPRTTDQPRVHQRGALRPSTQARPSFSMPPSSPSPETSALSTPKPRNKFTAEEDERLMRFVDREIRKGVDDVGNKIHIFGNRLYARFAKEAWLSRYRILASRPEAASNRSSGALGNPPVSSHKEGAQRPQTSSSLRPTPRRVRTKTEEAPPSLTRDRPSPKPAHDTPALTPQPLGAPASRGPAQIQTQPQTLSQEAEEELLSEEPEEEEDDEIARASAATSIWSAWQGYRVRKSLAVVANFPSLARGFLARTRFREALEQHQSQAHEEPEDINDLASQVDSDEETDPDKEADSEEEATNKEDDEESQLQRAELDFFIEAYEDVWPGSITQTPTICGKTISIWDLYRAFRSQKLPPDECDWLQVAEELGFALSDDDDDIAKEVFECFQDNLEHFVERMDAWLSQKDDPDVDEDGVQADSQDSESEGLETEEAREHQGEDLEMEEAREDQEEEEEELGGSQERTGLAETNEQPLPPPSSLPVAGTLKRRHEQVFHSDLGLSSGTPRKRARVEIPDTPQPSHAVLQQAQESSSSSPFERMSRSAASPTLPARRKHVEPETQDWRFDTQTQRFEAHAIHIDDKESDAGSLEATPSQQLRSEGERPITPIPIVLPTVNVNDTGPPRARAVRMSLFDEDFMDVSTPRPLPGLTDKSLGKRPESTHSSISPPARYDGAASGPPARKSMETKPATKRTLPASFRTRPAGNSARPSSEAPQMGTLPSSDFHPPSTCSHAPRRSYAFGTQPRGLGHNTPRAATSADRSSRPEASSATIATRPPQRRAPSRAAEPGAANVDDDSIMSMIEEELVPAHNRRSSGHTTASAAMPPSFPGHQRDAGQAAGQHRRRPRPRQAAKPSIADEVDRWVSLGYARKPITDLLQATCLSIPLLNQVMDENLRAAAAAGGAAALDEHARRRRATAVPAAKRGVWTAEDDRDLEAALGRGHAGAARRLAAKHGGERALTRRWRFLRDLRGVAAPPPGR